MEELIASHFLFIRLRIRTTPSLAEGITVDDIILLTAFSFWMTTNADAPVRTQGPAAAPAGTGASPGIPTGTASPTSNGSDSQCIFNGGNQSNINCVKSATSTVRVNHIVFACCIAITTAIFTVTGKHSSESIGRNQGSTRRVRNDTKRTTNAGFRINRRWLALLFIVANLGLVTGASICGFNGGNQKDVNCTDVAVPDTNDANRSLSAGDIGAIAIGSFSALITLLTFLALVINKDAVVGPNQTPVKHFRRVPIYRIVEGCTLLFGCGTWRGIERAMADFIQRGGKWHNLPVADVPVYP